MSNLSHKNHIEQGRSLAAYEYVEEAIKVLSKGKEIKEYKSYVRKMPMLIKTNGVGAALAFSFAKGSKEGRLLTTSAWGLLHHQLERWIYEGDQKALLDIRNNNITLSYALAAADSATYRAVSIELLGLLSWLKRFAEALIAGEPNS